MTAAVQIVDVTDAAGKVVAPEWLARAERVHRQLRPHLPVDYAGKMQRVFNGGARMSVAVKGDEVLGVGVHRIGENTADGVKMYVDDLVTDETKRSTGVGHALEMVAFAATCDRDLLLGIGADSVERGIDHRSFAAAFEAAAKAGLHRTIHAGEDGPSDNIAIAVRELGCERVDHGYRLLDDPELTAEVIDRRIPLTVCPTSNVVIANVVPDVASHPLAEQRRRGVLATVNSDDPGMMQFDIADEYVAVASAYGYSLEEMEQISLDGIEASWLPDDGKVAMRSRVLGEFDALRSEFGLPASA